MLLILLLILVLVEKGIRGGGCHSVLRYAKANNKDMANYNKNYVSPYLMYLDKNNLFG